MDNIKNKIEAILLLGGDEVKISDLAKFFALSEKEITDLARELRFERRNTGISLEIAGENIFLTTNPLYGEDVTKYFERGFTPRKLSAAAMETLSIIAYKQPITKGEISNIRKGMTVDGVIFSLLEKKFIRVCGVKKGPGRPKLYEVTDKFLGYLGVNAVEDLPNYQEIKTGAYNIADISAILRENPPPEEEPAPPETKDILYDDEAVPEELSEESVD